MGKTKGKEIKTMIKIFRNNEINDATAKEYRQYFSGHLSKPQSLDFIDDDVEIGTSFYKDFSADKPHVHPICSEYSYVICGSTKVLLLDTNEELLLNGGDLVHISKGTPYASKHKAGTKILFIKSPSTNDKTLVDVKPELKEWLSKW